LRVLPKIPVMGVRKPRIAVVGSANTDMIVRVPRLPRPGETVIGGRFHTAGGGKGANQAVAAARAGGEVIFIARVGDDPLGRQALEAFGKEGIDVRHVRKDGRAASGVALILVGADGENSIAVAPGANSRLSAADVLRARGAVRSADALLLQLEIPQPAVETAAGIAAAEGIPVILNPAPARKLGARFLRRISVLIPNETEAAMLAGFPIRSERDVAEAARRLRRKGVAAVVITLGARGAYFDDGRDRGMVPGFRVKPLDTTAAGDTFSAALAVAAAEGRALSEAVRFANAAAAISVTRLGAQPSAPDRKEIDRLYRKGRARP
jgi:ribokinase